MKLKAIDIAVISALAICVIACACFESTCEGLRDDILRLHVIANSDSAADQSLKLKVRDAVLKESSELFGRCETIDSAKAEAASSLYSIRRIARNAVQAEGYNYNVSIRLEKSYFPTRVYESITLPAGYYDAVKIVIGEGGGKNWWCVMFPCLCLPGACKKEDILKEVLNEKEIDLVTSDVKYEIRFWIIEKYYEIKESFR